MLTIGFTPRSLSRRTHWTRGWVSPRAGLDASEKKKTKISCPNLDIVVTIRNSALSWLVIRRAHLTRLSWENRPRDLDRQCDDMTHCARSHCGHVMQLCKCRHARLLPRPEQHRKSTFCTQTGRVVRFPLRSSNYWNI
jgi:hypothetical protein